MATATGILNLLCLQSLLVLQSPGFYCFWSRTVSGIPWTWSLLAASALAAFVPWLPSPWQHGQDDDYVAKFEVLCARGRIGDPVDANIKSRWAERATAATEERGQGSRPHLALSAHSFIKLREPVGNFLPTRGRVGGSFDLLWRLSQYVSLDAAKSLDTRPSQGA